MIDLSQLPPEGLRLEGREALVSLEGRDALRDMDWKLMVMPSDGDVFLGIQGKAVWEGTCARCLEPFDLPLVVDSAFLGSRDPELVAGGARTLGVQDLDVVFLPEAELDELALVREQFLLQVPMHPLCKDECQGLCPQCGKNWNKGHCQCVPEDRKEPGALAKALSGLKLNLEP